jgi:hypothetical protein
MRKALWMTLLAVPLAVAGFVFARTQGQAATPEQANAAYVCPLTGEELPCPKCCPLNTSQPQGAALQGCCTRP